MWPVGTVQGSLTRQFVLAGGVVMLATAALAGALASSIVTRTAIENTAAATALLMGSFVHPMCSVSKVTRPCHPRRSKGSTWLLGTDVFEQRFPNVEIWNAERVIAYSRLNEFVFRQFAPSEGLVTALNGGVVANYIDLDAHERVVGRRQFNKGDLEIYIPLRDDYSGRVIAVAEIHGFLAR